MVHYQGATVKLYTSHYLAKRASMAHITVLYYIIQRSTWTPEIIAHLVLSRPTLVMQVSWYM